MAETKAGNRGGLVRGPATDPMLMGGMKMRAIRSFATAGLVVLAAAATGAAATIPELLTKSQTQDLTTAECRQLSTALTDKTHSAQWGQIATALKSNWARSEISAGEHVTMVKAVSSGLNALEKSRMASALHSLYAADGPVLKQLNSGESVELVKLLSQIGDKAAAANLLGSWMVANDEWKTKADHDELPDLSEALRPGTSKVVAQQKAALTDLAWDKYLKAGAPDRSKATFKQLIHIVWIFHVELSEARLAELGPRVVGWLKTPAMLASARVQDVRVSEEFLPKFGLMGEYPDIAATWVSASDQWQALEEWALVILTKHLLLGKSELARQQAPKLVKLFLSKYFGETVQPPPAPKVIPMARTLFQLLSVAQRRQIVDKIAPGAGQLQKAAEFINLAHLIKDARRTGNAELVSAFATAVVNALKGGMEFPDDHHPYLLRFAFKADAAQQQLRQHVTDAEGAPRYSIAKMLAWAYAYTGKMESWLAYLDQKVGQTTGDRKASWLIARAYAQAVRSGRGYVPVAGETWLKQALEASATKPMKLVCVRILATDYAIARYEDKAKELIGSVKGQFAEGPEAAELALIEKSVEERVADIRRRAEAHEQRAPEAAKQAHIAELKRRLAKAQDKGDTQAVQRYERLLAAYK